MGGYTHYSFDLWLTLIKSNPLFKQHRCNYFHQHYNYKGISLQETDAIFRQIDIMGNKINERSGKNIDADELYLMVISQMNNNQVNLHDIDIETLYRQMEALVFDYMPMVYCNNTPAILSNLKTQGATTNILSNTGFIKGETLRKVLQEIGLEPYIDFQLYSDEEGMSKPNTAFFELMINKAGTDRSQIIHIGDNPLADVAGAERTGINAMLINSNHLSIQNLINETSHIFPS